jgi:hypothetical protein
MGLVLPHILHFNLDFGAGRYSNTIAVEIAFPVPARPYIYTRATIFWLGRDVQITVFLQEINKILLRI